MRIQHRYGFGGEAVTSARWGWVTAAIKKIVFEFQSRITQIKEFTSWLN